jgi:cytochrome c553
MKTLFVVCACSVLALSAGPARPQELVRSDQAARNVAVGTCAICHGPGGNSVAPKFPKLAGQREGYLVVQLKAFRSQSRGDPDAMAYMWGMAAPLSDEVIAALAQYYTSQKPAPGSAGDPAIVARGREIYAKGIASQNIPACGACHGANAEGSADFPRLAGQHAEYIIKQMYSFRNESRNVAVMHGVAKDMKLVEMEAVAAYLQSK